jgi:hypothetical protein
MGPLFWSTPPDQERRETMKIVLKALAFVCFLLIMLGVDFGNGISPRVVLVKDAEAIIGMPFTPVSAAGVARRTTRRVVATEAAVVTATAAAAPKPAAPPPPTVVVVSPSPAPAPAASAVPIGTVVQALPAACTTVVVKGANYSDCGGAFYKAAFQGNSLVYVVVPKPVP